MYIQRFIYMKLAGTTYIKFADICDCCIVVECLYKLKIEREQIIIWDAGSFIYPFPFRVNMQYPASSPRAYSDCLWVSFPQLYTAQLQHRATTNSHLHSYSILYQALHLCNCMLSRLAVYNAVKSAVNLLLFSPFNIVDAKTLYIIV